MPQVSTKLSPNLEFAVGPKTDYKDAIKNLDNLVTYVDKEIEGKQNQIELYRRWAKDGAHEVSSLEAKREALVLTAGTLRALEDSGIQIKPKVLAKQVRPNPPIEMMIR